LLLTLHTCFLEDLVVAGKSTCLRLEAGVGFLNVGIFVGFTVILVKYIVDI